MQSSQLFAVTLGALSLAGLASRRGFPGGAAGAVSSHSGQVTMTPSTEVLLIEDEAADRMLVQELVASRGAGAFTSPRRPTWRPAWRC